MSLYPGCSEHIPCHRKGWDQNVTELTSVIEAFYKWSDLQPNKTAYTWVNIKGKPMVKLTYKELLEKSTAVALAMRYKWGVKPGDRVLLLFPMGLNFVTAFWACLQMGAVAVPVYPVCCFQFLTTTVEIKCYLHTAVSKHQ
jgi:acyl-CoA synthetase (AMP-forming)/AMP-acid ligase II